MKRPIGKDHLQLIKDTRDTLTLLESPFGPGLVEAARKPGETHTIDEWKEKLRAQLKALER